MAGIGGPDDLHRPLGLAEGVAPAAARGLPRLAITVGALALAAVGALSVQKVFKGAGDGEPSATASIEIVAKPEPAPQPPRAANADETASISNGRRQMSAAEVEAQSGVRIVRDGKQDSGALIIQLEQAIGVHLNAAPDKRLVEKSAFGLLPKISADGQRPLDVYARPLLTSAKLKPGAPRIALLVGGFGLNAGDTREAVSSLPGAVTLGFAPYGPELDRQVAHARDGGHEIVLQLPMEPFDYPTNDPGPHTLVTGAAAAQSQDHLRWHLGRFTGYVGVSNFLGGKFMADAPAFTAVLRETQARGLIFVDDGTAARSQTVALSAKLGAPAVVIDVALDADPRTEAVDAALIRLETLARANGSATGSAQALPGTIEKIARFAKALEGRGIALVPVSALAGKPRAASGEARAP